MDGEVETVNIQPISDSQNDRVDTLNNVEARDPVCLTKNNNGFMSLQDFKQYKHAGESIENALDTADRQAQTLPLRYTHEDVFSSAKKIISRGQKSQTP